MVPEGKYAIARKNPLCMKVVKIANRARVVVQMQRNAFTLRSPRFAVLCSRYWYGEGASYWFCAFVGSLSHEAAREDGAMNKAASLEFRHKAKGIGEVWRKYLRRKFGKCGVPPCWHVRAAAIRA